MSLVLINYGRRIVESKQDLKKYTLYVAESNISAIRLYQNSGFNIKTSLNSSITQLLFKEKSWLYMTSNICDEEEKVKYTMKSDWWLGFIGFFNIPTALLFLKGNASPTVLIGLLWFLMFIPQKK